MGGIKYADGGTLDLEKILARFQLMAGLRREDALPYTAILRDAADSLLDRVRPGVDIDDHMGRLCGAAAAAAYYTYCLLGTGGQVKVGDISVSDGEALGRAKAVKEQYLAEAACCLEPEQALWLAGGDEA